MDKEKLLKKLKEIIPDKKRIVAHDIPVTPRGAGTNLVGSTVPVDGGIILDFSHMDKILELDENTMTITVQPGLLLQDLQ